MPMDMTRRFDHPPTTDEIEAIARAAMIALPEPFAAHLRNVVLVVEELADEELLGALGIEHPLDLTGVYEGLPIGERSVEHSGTLPDRIRLFRRAILDEWIEDGESLEHLVRHILIHEAGHHFGFSDDAMHALEEEA
jgi:predicted Zn-dependent protease with MMP-like domain